MKKWQRMKRLDFFLLVLIIWIFYDSDIFAEATLQQQIDQTPAGGTLVVKSGTFSEPITINKPITIKGSDDSTLTYAGDQSFINITGQNVHLMNLEIEATGFSSIEESAIVLSGKGHTLNGLTIKSVGTGIKLDEANQVAVTESSFIGISEGHAINLWESSHNQFTNNSIRDVQDGFYVEYSHHNTFKNNTIRDAHYGIHLMYSNYCLLEGNKSTDNFTGAMIMGAEAAEVRKNYFLENSENVNSHGLLLYDSRNVVVAENEVSRNRIGIFIEKASMNTVKANRIQANFVGIQFKESMDNQVYRNDFLGNVNDAQAVNSEGNQMNGNYWDAASKIDSDGDGISELTYQADPYFLALTEEVPEYQFFFQAPGMSILQKMLKSTDAELLTDSKPLMESTHKWVHTDRPELAVWLISGFMFVCSLYLFRLGRKQR